MIVHRNNREYFMIDGKKEDDNSMNEIEAKKEEIVDLLWELWDLLPEPKWMYPYYKQKVSMAIDNWYPPKTEKRDAGWEKKIAAREKGDVGI